MKGAASVRIAVVGAGLSGLVAAYRLVHAGADVVVLEARKRIGGRVWRMDVGGLLFDAGAEAIDDAHRSILALADELEVATWRTEPWAGVQGERSPLLAALEEKIAELAARIDPAHPEDTSDASMLDTQTLHGWLVERSHWRDVAARLRNQGGRRRGADGPNCTNARRAECARGAARRPLRGANGHSRDRDPARRCRRASRARGRSHGQRGKSDPGHSASTSAPPPLRSAASGASSARAGAGPLRRGGQGGASVRPAVDWPAAGALGCRVRLPTRPRGSASRPLRGGRSGPTGADDRESRRCGLVSGDFLPRELPHLRAGRSDHLGTAPPRAATETPLRWLGSLEPSELHGRRRACGRACGERGALRRLDSLRAPPPAPRQRNRPPRIDVLCGARAAPPSLQSGVRAVGLSAWSTLGGLRGGRAGGSGPERPARRARGGSADGAGRTRHHRRHERGFRLAESAWVLYAARFGQGVGSSLAWTGGLAWLVAAAPRGRRGELIGIAMGAAVAGALLGPVLGGVASL